MSLGYCASYCGFLIVLFMSLYKIVTFCTKKIHQALFLHHFFMALSFPHLTELT